MTEKRFKVILDYYDEMGITYTETDDVIAMKVNQNTNTIGFCNSIVGLLNSFDDEHKGIQKKVWGLLEFLEDEYDIDKRKIIDWWNGDVE